MKATIHLPDHIIQHLIDYDRSLKQALHDLGGLPFVDPCLRNSSVEDLIESLVYETALERRKYLDGLYAPAPAGASDNPRLDDWFDPDDWDDD